MVTLFYQIIKIFYLQKIDFKFLKGVPGLNKDEIIPTNVFEKSNIYTTAEIILLKWLSVHKTRLYSSERNIIKNFRQDLRDATTLNALIISH